MGKEPAKFVEGGIFRRIQAIGLNRLDKYVHHISGLEDYFIEFLPFE